MMLPRLLYAATLSATILLLGATPVFADGECPIILGPIVGSVSNAGVPAVDGMVVGKGDTVETGPGSQATLDLAGVGTLKLGPSSSLFVETSYCPEEAGGAVRLRLIRGSLWATGSSTDRKVDITTSNFAAVLGTSTLSITARRLDTTFTLTQGRQEISTNEWVDTVDVQTYTFPFDGEVSTLYALAGRVVVVPWGGRGAIVREGQQATHGYDETHISSKPQEIDQSELLYAEDGSYRGPDM